MPWCPIASGSVMPRPVPWTDRSRARPQGRARLRMRRAASGRELPQIPTWLFRLKCSKFSKLVTCLTDIFKYSATSVFVIKGDLTELKLIFPKAVNGLRGKLFAFLVLLKFQTLSGYYVNATRDYDITWTMPQCVLCLRLIGLAFDIWDGTKPKESLSKDQVRHHCILCFVFEAHWAGV